MLVAAAAKASEVNLIYHSPMCCIEAASLQGAHVNNHLNAAILK